MDDYLFTFRSVTAAMQGGRVLERGGIPHTLQRLPKQLREQGCGYGLKVRADRLARAKTMLQDSGLEARRLYQRMAGDWQEAEK